MNNILAPIIVFCYDRPHQLKLTIESLSKNFLAPESDIIFFSDGCKDMLDYERIMEVRNIINNVTGFRNVRVIESKENIGLAKSIINGVSKIINEYK